ncbi:MAG: sigma 54-interacting transcriptional regulator [Gammaproteobacteria bacterium]|nr:sigma 54-interacting transcriptional regulator [Gammaproteobacteria bacterium]
MAKDKSQILLVDDDPSLLKLLSMRLEAEGYAVSTASSGEEALHKLKLSPPDLLITDLRMEGMDGMGVLKAVQQAAPSLPVIMITAHGSIPDAVAAAQQGVFAFLTKPIDKEELLKTLRKALEVSGRSESADEGWRAEIITRSPVMQELLAQAKLVAGSDVSILLLGESGTGKELLAQAIHKASKRAKAAFVALNCGAMPEQLLESELFGHAKGAFTGAVAAHRGLFQTADTGTIFLDEIGDMPFPLQVKLLRVLQERQIRPVGSTQVVEVDARVISATHSDLEAALAKGEFREDLFYRLNVVSLKLPPLRDRREDIPLLANHFLKKIIAKAPGHVRSFAPDAVEMLVSAPWPGNVRQLYNLVEQTVALCTTPVIPASLVQKALRSGGVQQLPSLNDARDQFERDYLVKLLQISDGNVSQAARLAQRNRTDFYKLLAKHEIDLEAFKGKDD